MARNACLTAIWPIRSKVKPSDFGARVFPRMMEATIKVLFRVLVAF